MIMEERDYRVRAGKLALFVRTYEEHGLHIQLKYLDKFHGYFTSEHGELNHVVAWWSFQSLDDRFDRRMRMLADPEWSAYMDRVDGLLDVQHSRILRPTSFSPIRGEAS